MSADSSGTAASTTSATGGMSPTTVSPEMWHEAYEALVGLAEVPPSAPFACGGIVHTTAPVSLYFRGSDMPCELSNADAIPERTASLHRLIESCKVASFGHNGENVIDLTYRRALMLDTADFSINWSPCHTDILKTIHSVLMPYSCSHVRAHLYRVNVYTDGGFFKSHVDTPRSERDHFGSLVVCFPVSHKGGVLTVQHGGETVKFDFASDFIDTAGASSSSDHSVSNACRLPWAAFFADAEHEISPVTDGARVTVTWHLYGDPVHPPTSPVASLQELAAASARSTLASNPYHRLLRTLLCRDDNWGHGAVLGMICSHAYPHTANTEEVKRNTIHCLLKGSDALLWHAATALGLKVEMRPLILPSTHYERKFQQYIKDGFKFTQYNSFDFPHLCGMLMPKKFVSAQELPMTYADQERDRRSSRACHTQKGMAIQKYGKYFSDVGELYLPAYTWFLQAREAISEGKSLDDVNWEYDEMYDGRECVQLQPSIYWPYSESLASIRRDATAGEEATTEGGPSESSTTSSNHELGLLDDPRFLRTVRWLNDWNLTKRQLQGVNLKMGNEATMTYVYSCAALLIFLPAAKDPIRQHFKAQVEQEMKLTAAAAAASTV